MIPRAFITAWRAHAPWAADAQVEQDLVLSRALIEIFSEPVPASVLAFRGGTALHKLYLENPARYSEDLDFVYLGRGPVGPLMDALHKRLDPWLGKPRWRQSASRLTLIYRFQSEIPPITPLRLKIEINTDDREPVMDLVSKHFEIQNDWFSGGVAVPTYTPEELLATKLRALYQRKKGRDLFDLARAAEWFPELDLDGLARCFQAYLAFEGNKVSRAEFEANLAVKQADPAFTGDIRPLLAAAPDVDVQVFDPAAAIETIKQNFVSRLPGAPWKGQE